MNFHIADSFTAALARLNGQEQKQVKTAAFDLQIDPSRPGLQMHRLTGGRDANFWSARVNQDIRIIIHRTEASFMLAYVDHHDDAYAWAARRRIEAHERTGAIQIVEVHERIEEAAVAAPLAMELSLEIVAPGSPLFAALTTDDLLDIGAPADWIADIRTWTEERFFELSDKLPAEATEALFDFAATGVLTKPTPVTGDPYSHPDTLRRVQPVATEDELRVALDYPWEKWSVFLHPSQREIVERDFPGPARVTGSAGTGKTIVALHRAARAVNDDAHAKVLLTTFSRPLANALQSKLRVLLEHDAAKLARVSVASFEDAASELYQLAEARRPVIAPPDLQQAALKRAISETGYAEMSGRFVWSEWRNVIDAWGIEDMAAYANVPRIGRRNRLGSKQREALWSVFETTKSILAARGAITGAALFAAVATHYASRDAKPYTHIIVDEAQDLGVSELRMMAGLANGPNSLFFGGDLAQRIFQQPFSWISLGVDVRGRSSSLRINYRTSRQIREMADRLLPQKIADVDGIEESRLDAQSVFEGPLPQINRFEDESAETECVASFIEETIASGVDAHEVGVFVRSDDQLGRVRSAIAATASKCRQLSGNVEEFPDHVAIGTMHFAKGLEFKVVVVMACDDEVLPLQSRVDDAMDEEELREVFDTERHLFYVACTRARDKLLVTGVKPTSDFIDDLVPV
jgi:mRNA-degrading endonuclease RelE of RelBE toxin-antitoxin system